MDEGAEQSSIDLQAEFKQTRERLDRLERGRLLFICGSMALYFEHYAGRERRQLRDLGESLKELESDYERQRWADFTDRYYCAGYASVLRRLLRDHRNSCCVGRLSNRVKPQKVKPLMVRVYHEKEPSLCATACRLVDTLDLLRQDVQEPQLDCK